MDRVVPTYHYNLGLLLDEVVVTYATQPALRYPEREYRYQDIAQWVDALAGLLIAKGVRRGEVIAIGHNKRPLSYAMMLAALRLGVVYVNIDVASPAVRTSRILQMSGARLLFFDDPAYRETIELLAMEHGCPLMLLTEDSLPQVTEADRLEQQRLSRQVDGACIAYIMFTSGSTGMPKGVAVTHQNLLHFIAWGQEYFRITTLDNFANLSPMYFDNSVFDFYVGLFSGASLSPVYRELLTNPYELVTYVGRMSCTIWFSVPSLLIYLMAMKALTAESLPCLRTIVFGGEGYPKVELKKLHTIFSNQAGLVNVYGPTECTCICSAHKITDEDFRDLTGLPTLGRLNQNFDYRILDDQERDASSGELCLIGPNVAAGYFNDMERTSLTFQTLTEPCRFMKRMYRTGDLVQEIDGQLYFIGRRDNQIKHMGYRIELEEIEFCLSGLPGVDQAAVVYQRVSTAFGKIFGFVSSRDDIEELLLMKALSELLPEYMLPSQIFVLETLPKNANGKVDRQALSASLINR